MNDLTPKIDYFRSVIRQQYGEELRTTSTIPAFAIEKVLAENPFRDLTEQDLVTIRNHLEFHYAVSQNQGHSLKSDYKPWLAGRAESIDFRYWGRLRRYYVNEGVLPAAVVSRLDNVTDEILDYCGDPEDTSSWQRRGMVMGHVQSGKTTNYAALISKASDAGYKIIILLAGLTNSLRQQTQERMDEAYIGKKSFFGNFSQELMPVMDYCDWRDGTRRLHPVFGTTRDLDFDSTKSQFGATLSNLKDPIIFVVKKNKSILTNLLSWLDTQSQVAKINEPLLLIDDEADNASVNTHREPNNSTAINDLIRKILLKFDRSTYVGYTATPFANIFIDPGSEDEMRGEDLFPRHFIKALDPPTNYVGAERIFSEEGNLRKKMIRKIYDYQDILPLKHKRDHVLTELPPSLYTAIRAFNLTRAIRVLRGDGKKHCSMMINVSRFNDIQESVEGLVYQYQQDLNDAIKINALKGDAAFSDPFISALKSTFEEEYSNTEFTFQEILTVLDEASNSIRVTTVNMRGGALEYDKHRENGLHVIAIGGLALSRGLTLEGLATTYLLRNSAASDTLMQMARWFGYRHNNEDICRLYTCPSSIDHYKYITDAVEELRTELKRMEDLNETPEKFGLKVRRSETGIRITASNKMRSAQKIELAQGFDGKHTEGVFLNHARKTNETNLATIIEFLNSNGPSLSSAELASDKLTAEADKHLMWADIDGFKVLETLKRFEFHSTQPGLGKIDGKTSLFLDYCTDRIKSELHKWDVALLLNKGRQTEQITLEKLRNGELPLRRRNSGIVENNCFKPSGGMKSIRDPNEDPLIFLNEDQVMRAKKLKADGILKGDKPFCQVRKKPLMLVHVFKADEVGVEKFEFAGEPIVSLSFLMPGTKLEVVPRIYEANRVWQNQMSSQYETDDDDEAITDVKG